MTPASPNAKQNLSPPLRVVVQNVRRIDKGALVAVFDAEIPAWNLLLKECKWFHTDGQPDSITPPTSFWTTDSGKRIYLDVIQFTTPETLEAFVQACLANLK